mmetsp:Transcript_68574/g.163643  ORF Transcript_68574/g.163643 Transcript_68574/m.163643 type:complete len:345 (-) Transcript_68574:177-1211(-)
MHPHQPRHLELLARVDVHHLLTLLDDALVDAQVRQLPELALLELESQGDEGLLARNLHLHLSLPVVDIEGEVLDLGRAREVVDNTIQQLLAPAVLVRGSHHHGHERQLEGSAADSVFQLLDSRLLLHQELVADDVVDVRQNLDQKCPLLLAELEHFRGDFILNNLLALLADVVRRLHRHQVHHTFKRVLSADVDLHGRGVQEQLILQLLDDPPGIRTRPVHLVDERQARNTVPLHLAVNGVGLALHPAHRAQHQHRTIQHAQRSFHLDGEVNVPRSIDNVDVIVLPSREGRRRLDRDALFSLEFHAVHLRTHAVLTAHLVDLEDAASVEEDTLRERGLARVDVR